jgi:hypothetical protein
VVAVLKAHHQPWSSAVIISCLPASSADKLANQLAILVLPDLIIKDFFEIVNFNNLNTDLLTAEHEIQTLSQLQKDRSDLKAAQF